MDSQPGGQEAVPDAMEGIPLADLKEGEPFAATAQGEPVVLVRRGEDVLAIGGACTHYGAPLHEGLVTGDTIRCPWHHACFSLRSGEAVAAPALNPVACYEVEVRDGTAVVRGKSENTPLARMGRQATGPASVVIIGGGAAGSAAAETLRREGYEGPVTVLDPDPAAPYDRPNLSKDYLAGEAAEEWIPLRPPGFYQDNDIHRETSPAATIDVANRTVTLADGRRQEFGALLLATGAVARRLTIPGADRAHVHTLRSLDDCRAIIRASEGATNAVVLGASFIGMEVAASLRARGLQVTVVAPDAVPFEKVLGREVGEAIQRVHEENGVEFRLGRTPAAILEDSVRLDDGSDTAAQLVVMGVGVVPDIRLAEAAGLQVDDGVVVDAHLRTSVPAVYAAGDIARFPDARTGERLRVEHWVLAQRQGQDAARSILGHGEPFAVVPFFWTEQFGLSLRYVGHTTKWDVAQIDGDLNARDCTIRYLRGGRTLAAASIGRNLENLRLEVELEGGNRAAAGPMAPIEGGA